MARSIDFNEYLEIDGEHFACVKAWFAPNLAALSDSAPYLGEDIVIPGVDGTHPVRMYRGPLRFQLDFFVYGKVDFMGNYALPDQERATVIDNVDYLVEGCLAPVSAGDGTVPIVWHLPNGHTKVADGKVIPPFQFRSVAGCGIQGMLDLLIPAGAWTDGA